MAPLKFKDLSKSTNDLLNNDYNFDRKFKLKTKTANGVEFTTEGSLIPNKATSGKLSAKFKPFEGISVVKLCVTTQGRFQVEATLENAFEGASFTVAAEDGANKAPQGNVSMKYGSDSFTFNSSVDIVDGPTLYGAGSFGYEGFVLGGEMKYNTQFDDKDAAPSLKDYNAGLAYKGPDYIVSLTTKKKVSEYNLGVHHKVNSDVEVASNFTLNPSSGNKLLTLGGTYTIDKETKFVGKVDSNGVVSTNFIQILRPAVKLIASAQVDAKNLESNSHKFGLQLVLG